MKRERKEEFRRISGETEQIKKMKRRKRSEGEVEARAEGGLKRWGRGERGRGGLRKEGRA